MTDLLLGSTVHYLMQLEGMVGTVEYAAILSKVYEPHNPKDFPEGSIEACADAHVEGDVCLHILTENGIVVRDNVPYSEEKLSNTWHWVAD